MKKAIIITSFITALICYVVTTWYIRKYERENFKLKIEINSLKKSMEFSDYHKAVIEKLGKKYKGIKQHLIVTQCKIENGIEYTIEKIPQNKYGLYFQNWIYLHGILRYEMRFGLVYPVADVFNSFIYQEYGNYHDEKGNLKRGEHTGIDIVSYIHDGITSAKLGKVTHIGYDKYWGNYIIIYHGKIKGEKFETFYAHLGRTLIKINDIVDTEIDIAEIGSTGNSTAIHLHFAVILGGYFVNPVKNSTYFIPVNHKKVRQFIY